MIDLANQDYATFVYGDVCGHYLSGEDVYDEAAFYHSISFMFALSCKRQIASHFVKGISSQELRHPSSLLFSLLSLK